MLSHGRLIAGFGVGWSAEEHDAAGTDVRTRGARMDDFVDTSDDNGGVHINSGIQNRAFYLVATALGPATGLLQRVGLTIVDAWIVRRALRSGRGARRSTVAPSDPSSTSAEGVLRTSSAEKISEGNTLKSKLRPRLTVTTV